VAERERAHPGGVQELEPAESGENEFVLFKAKLENRFGRAELGFLICSEHFAETADIEKLRSSKSDFLIVLIDRDRLHELVQSSDRATTLRRFTDQAALA
jgi:hypothetical protein